MVQQTPPHTLSVLFNYLTVAAPQSSGWSLEPVADLWGLPPLRARRFTSTGWCASVCLSPSAETQITDCNTGASLSVQSDPAAVERWSECGVTCRATRFCLSSSSSPRSSAISFLEILQTQTQVFSACSRFKVILWRMKTNTPPAIFLHEATTQDTSLWKYIVNYLQESTKQHLNLCPELHIFDFLFLLPCWSWPHSRLHGDSLHLLASQQLHRHQQLLHLTPQLLQVGTRLLGL